LSCHVRLMRKTDAAQVTEIDREAFPTMWPPANYQRELENLLARYIVACDSEIKAEESYTKASPKKGLSAVLSRIKQPFNPVRFSGYETRPLGGDYIIGFAGFWTLANEAHITNIAVRECYLRRGIGELLLISTIDLAKEMKVKIITLEVRASNTAAQSLYYKYGFIRVGLRPGYYIDNREDAVLMSTEDIISSPFQTQFQKLKRAYHQKRGISPNQI